MNLARPVLTLLAGALLALLMATYEVPGRVGAARAVRPGAAPPPSTPAHVAQGRVDAKQATSRRTPIQGVPPREDAPAMQWPAPAEHEELPENEAMQAEDYTAEQRAWRAIYARQQQDDAWTEQVRQQLERLRQVQLDGPLMVENLSCHQTVCRMLLQFTDARDASAFLSAAAELGPRRHVQPLDPFEGEGAERPAPMYELLLERERPSELPPAALEAPPRTLDIPASPL